MNGELLLKINFFIKTSSFILTSRKIPYHIFLASTKIYWNLGQNIIKINLPYLQPSSPNICGLIMKIKTWDQITHEFKIDKKLYFKWIQLVHAIPYHWKKKLTENTINSQNLFYLNHHLIKSNQICSSEKLTTKELYLISLQHETTTPTPQKYFESMFRGLTLQWKHVYTLPHITTIDSKLWCFQYKILHNTLYVNQKLFLFRKHDTSLFSFRNLEDETVIHLFAHCSKTKRLWC